MNSNLERLLSAASPSILRASSTATPPFLWDLGAVGGELLALLESRNGFFAFESSLHVFPSGGSKQGCITLESWNDPDGWRKIYGDLVPAKTVFFAQDAYGNQFAATSSGVQIFYSEFAEFEPLSDCVDGWATAILNDWRGYTGYDLSHEWQTANRALKEGERLVPKIPFVLGGEYALSNLYAGRIEDAMRFRGSLARQLTSVPDGARVKIKVTQ